MHKPEFAWVKETHKLLLDFELQTDHSVTARRPDQALITKINLLSNGFCRFSGPSSENKAKR